MFGAVLDSSFRSEVLPIAFFSISLMSLETCLRQATACVFIFMFHCSYLFLTLIPPFQVSFELHSEGEKRFAKKIVVQACVCLVHEIEDSLIFSPADTIPRRPSQASGVAPAVVPKPSQRSMVVLRQPHGPDGTRGFRN